MLNQSTFFLYRKGTTTAVATTVSYGGTTKKPTLNPTTSLRLATTYKAAATEPKDLTGNNPLDQNPSVADMQPKVSAEGVRYFTIKRQREKRG